MDQWLPDFLERSPMFEPLRARGVALNVARWPTLDEMQALLDSRRPPVITGGGAALRFVAQSKRPKTFEEKYEARIYLKGEVQMRGGNWHDLFNALVWLTFPRAKAALNARHYRALEQQQAAGTPNRGPVQDAMTLFDESGVIVTASNGELLRQLREFRWKELFWHNRARIEPEMRFYVFGHALHEKALRRHSRLTGHGILLAVEGDFFSLPSTAQLERLDAMLEQRLLDTGTLNATRELAPLPVLGVPGWCADNEREQYYDDTGYFRPGRVSETRPRTRKARNKPRAGSDA